MSTATTETTTTSIAITRTTIAPTTLARIIPIEGPLNLIVLRTPLPGLPTTLLADTDRLLRREPRAVRSAATERAETLERRAAADIKAWVEAEATGVGVVVDAGAEPVTATRVKEQELTG